MFITNVPSFLYPFLAPVFFLYYAFSFVLPSSSKPDAKIWLFLKPPNLVCRFGGVFSKIQKKQMLTKLTRSKLDFD